MKWKPLTICLIICLVLFMGVLGAQAKKSDSSGGNDNSSGPPDEPTVVPKFIYMTGSVDMVELYELKETLIVYDYDNNVWVEKLVPVDEPDELYFLTVSGDQDVDMDDDGTYEFELKDGEQWLLDFGPEWYAPDPCLVASYICEDGGGLIKVGPFVLGYFDCNGAIVDTVVSNDPSQSGAKIPLMSRTARNALPDASSVYAFGRSGGSEIVWIWDDPADDYVLDENGDIAIGEDGNPVINEEGLGVFVRYPKAGSNIVWEMDDGSETEQTWWRGEAPPQAMTKELSCSVTEE